MNENEILEKVKIGLEADDNNDNDRTLKLKILAVREYMINAGVSKELIETDLGLGALTIGVNDIWDLTSGGLKFSSIFEGFLSQLALKSIMSN